MVTMVGTEETVEDLLSNLIKLDYDAAETFEAAINRLESEEYKLKLKSFREEQLSHTKNLGEVLRDMKKNVPEGPDLKQILSQGKVVIAHLFGDKAILNAMKANLDDTNAAYEKALNHKQITPEVRGVLQKNLEDEVKHRGWIMEQMRDEERVKRIRD